MKALEGRPTTHASRPGRVAQRLPLTLVVIGNPKEVTEQLARMRRSDLAVSRSCEACGAKPDVALIHLVPPSTGLGPSRFLCTDCLVIAFRSDTEVERAKRVSASALPARRKVV